MASNSNKTRRYRDNPDDQDDANNNHDNNHEDFEGEEEYPPRPRGSGRRGRRGYATIDTEAVDDEDPLERRRRHRRLAAQDRTRSCMTCMWLCMMMLLMLGAASLILYRYESRVHPELAIFGGNVSVFGDFFRSDDGDDDDEDDDMDGSNAGYSSSKHKHTDNKATTTTTTTTTTAKSSSAPNIPKDSTTIHYNPAAALDYSNPFNFTPGNWYGSVAVPPPTEDFDAANNRLGYFTQPSIQLPHLLFITEGDLYYTQWTSDGAAAAMKLTTTVGNVNHPQINPVFPYIVAFTATYTAHREVYLMDMRPSHRSQPSMRLTYWDTSSAISSVVGWKSDGLTLLFSAQSRDVSLPDRRLYQLTLSDDILGDDKHPQNEANTKPKQQVMQITPIPLSQAIDGVFSNQNDCIYFTRFSQSSSTNRYVGGTAESLWAYCEGEDEAVPLTPLYKGTTKAPQIGTINGSLHLFFLADWDTDTFTTPATINLFAAPLPSREQLYASPSQTQKPLLTDIVALTHASCDFDGLAVQEYSIDGRSNVVVRIGADLYSITASIGRSTPERLNIVVYSDFHEHQERIIPLSFPQDMTTVDVYDTAFGTTAALLSMRGQVFSAPVLDEASSSKYQGAGMNLPPRRYRVAPGSTVGGMVRILSATVVPMPQEVKQSTRRLALLLATAVGGTAEHGFYLTEVQSDAPTGFVDATTLPTPFLSGDLGSVMSDSVTVSPCGRRMAWTDTNGRICVKTMPMYSNETYVVLPQMNANGQPMIGIDAEISFSPGGRYLAITHAAKNQFLVISIADLGDANMDGVEEVADIVLGKVIQATPDRFNSYSPYWGKTAMDFGTAAIEKTLQKLQGDGDTSEAAATAATVLYFLSDRNLKSDVSSPWGTRAPSPHFPNTVSVYALPLVLERKDDLFPMHGIYAGGGAAELWADGMLQLEQEMEELMALTPLTSSSTSRAAEGSGATRRLGKHHYLTAAVARRRRLEDPTVALDPAADAATPTAAPADNVESPTLFGTGGGTTPATSSAPSTSADNDFSPTLDTGPTPSPTATTGDATVTESLPGSVGAGNTMPATAAPVTAAPVAVTASVAATFAPATTKQLTETESPSTAVSASTLPEPATTEPFTDSNDTLANTEPSLITNGTEVTNTTPAVVTIPTRAPIVATTMPPTAAPTVAPTVAVTSPPTPIPTLAPSMGSSSAPSSAPSQAEPSPVFPNDLEIDFGSTVRGLGFARRAYRVAGVPAANYKSIVCQLKDDPSMVLEETDKDGTASIKFFAFEDFPSDKVEPTPILPTSDYLGSGVSTSRDHLILIFSPGVMKVVPNTATSVMKMLTDKELESDIVDTNDMSISVWPSLEYEQMFNDAWRMLRDYFYDTNMNGVDWPQMHARYKGLVKRCTKREELDDVLAQMAAELSALHVFVYGGEYSAPFAGSPALKKAHAVASLGATFERSPEYMGYIVKSIAYRDPDFNLLDDSAVYSPLSHQVLSLSGQKGLDIGDVIVGINGESVMRVPDLHMLLRGKAGRSIRLDVIRQPHLGRQLLDDPTASNETLFTPTPVITVPLTQSDADTLRYDAWEYKTRTLARKLAAERGFTTGYVHLQSMSGPDDIDAFYRGFFPDYDKETMIIDVRHNRGGNIDSWLLDVLQRKAWMYWQGRATNVNNGGLGWDQQFAFRGHIVVLIDEKSSSDAEGFARGVAELGLGKLVGTRTWGGGIWLSSDNTLVDGGIATAPEIGTYNDHFGWGLGIEQQGVEPDVVVDNNPRVAFDGRDQQLEKAMDVLKEWLQAEPIVQPKAPGPKNDVSLKSAIENCPAKR